MLRRLVRLLVLGCVLVVSSAGQALTAPSPAAGAGRAGVAVSDVRYHVAPQRPDLVARVTFTVSPGASGTIRLRLTVGGPSRKCAIVDGRAACDLSRAPVPLAAAELLAVSAV